MASANIHYFAFYLEELEEHSKRLDSLLKNIHPITCNAWGIHKAMRARLRPNLLLRLESDIKTLASLTQMACMVANNAHDVSNVMLETCQRWLMESRKR